MTIAELAERSKATMVALPRDILLVCILVLSSSASFGLGVLAGRDLQGEGSERGFTIEQIPLTASSLEVSQKPAPPAPISVGGQVVASKNGTKYFLPWCGGASQIKEENKIWFADNEAAEKAGYTPAGNCKGL